MPYPGDTADPKDVAGWMASLAIEYGLPGILPVMTSCVELTDAWTGPGDVKQVAGYLNNVDHDSYGYFQQRPSQGWGTWEQVTNADYATRKFCSAAAALKDEEWHEGTTDPKILGRWCQVVQRSGYPDAYANKGYPMAIELLAPLHNESQGRTWYGWSSANSWTLVRHGADVQEDGGLWQKYGYYTYETPTSWNLVYHPPASPPKTRRWPVANDPPRLNSPWYVERCPTRYSWPGNRDDINTLAWWVVDNFNVSVNTYHHHPEELWIKQGISREHDSLDVWGPGGRGDPLDLDTGNVVFTALFNDPNPPDIDWIIWNEVIYGAWNNWQGEPFGDGSTFMAHRDHIHTTYVQ